VECFHSWGHFKIGKFVILRAVREDIFKLSSLGERYLAGKPAIGGGCSLQLRREGEWHDEGKPLEAAQKQRPFGEVNTTPEISLKGGGQR